MSATSIQAIEKVRDALQCALAKPIRTSREAAQLCLKPKHFRGIFGAKKESHDEVSISVLSLQQLLAGEVTLEDFKLQHGWDGGWNPFAFDLKAGRMIKSAEVVDGTDLDDD